MTYHFMIAVRHSPRCKISVDTIGTISRDWLRDIVLLLRPESFDEGHSSPHGCQFLVDAIGAKLARCRETSHLLARL